ncbi:MAG: hypothetical protein IJH50_06820 [Kiritimatiellae bacterium]|nr:hypothetical protein [Kiritimatiellia bacterium]
MNARKERERNKGKAMEVLAKMNDLVRGRDFAKMVDDERFEQLRCKIVRLGWLAFCKSLEMKEVAGKREMWVQLKLVDPDSKEAKMYDF